MSSEDLERNLSAAANDLKRGAGGKAGQTAEKKYGQAYMALVKAGLRPKLKAKYRGGVK